jgi:phosphomevalonate kinase
MKKTAGCKLLLAILVFNFQLSFSQEPCATDKKQKELFDKDPEAKRAYLEAEKQLLEANLLKQNQLEQEKQQQVKSKKRKVKRRIKKMN